MTFYRLIPSVLVALSVQAAADLHPVDLRCDGQTDLAVVRATPELSWRVETASRGQAQSAWQILVASNPRTLAEDQGDLWDSGKVAASRSPFVRYAGKPLASGQRCHWKVRCWNTDGKPSGWSAPALWEAAPQSPADWQGARWVDDGRANPTRDEDFYQPDPAPLLRREFTLAKPVVRARLHVAGLGLCYASLNGERLTDQFLDPPWTAFEKRILFRTLDVAAQLIAGTNCLGLTLGNGWYNPLPLRMWGQRNIRSSLATGRPRVIACLVAEHPDGTRTTITTGPGWTTAAGPTLRNSVYLGEERDARRALPGWDRAGFDASQWQPARVTDDSLEPLQPLAMLPVRAGTHIPAVAVTTPSPGMHIVDFGRNFTGVPEVDLKVPVGTQVRFRFGEVLNKDGTLNPLTSVCGQIKGKRKGPDGSEVSVGGPGAPAIAWQQDVIIARGGGLEKYRPDFTFHGFRFMEITGLPEPPVAAACRGIPLHTELPDAGTFASSDERLNRIQEMCRRTFLANVVSVQSDCPHRERFGYGGDIVATSEAFLMNFDMAGFYAKTVRDWADAARPDGRFTDTAPFVGIDYCGVGWAMVHPLLLEQLHQHYGNRSLIAEQYPAALRWLDGEARRRKQGLVTNGLGDHEALGKAGGAVLTTPMFIDSARRVARLARLAGRNDEAARCEVMADESAAANGFVWPSAIPTDCPLSRSTNLTGIYFTGRLSDYRLADTWYPSWASDGNLYSPFTDGQVDGVSSGSGKGANAQTGHAVMIGDDPLHLIISNTSLPKVASALPYHGRYPCGSLVKDGIWYYGTYCLGPAGTHKHCGFDWNWPNLGPMPGFQISRDLGKTWAASPLSPEKPLFPEPVKFLGPVKMGAPHFVDFGKNMEHSPDGKAYLLGMGAVENDPHPRPCIKPSQPGTPFEPNPGCTNDFAHANLSWISADQAYLARVRPAPETINDLKAYEFFAGHDTNGMPLWTSDFSKIKPLLEWNNHMGCVTATYVPGLKKYLMCVTDGWPTVAKMNSYILEADAITGPWRIVAYLKDFGEQAYFLNFPSKFMSADGRILWLCYSANFSPGWNGVELKINPPGGRYGLCLHEVKLLGPGERNPSAENSKSPQLKSAQQQ